MMRQEKERENQTANNKHQTNWDQPGFTPTKTTHEAQKGEGRKKQDHSSAIRASAKREGGSTFRAGAWSEVCVVF